MRFGPRQRSVYLSCIFSSAFGDIRSFRRSFDQADWLAQLVVVFGLLDLLFRASEFLNS
jgi:hypothetical protein